VIREFPAVLSTCHTPNPGDKKEDKEEEGKEEKEYEDEEEHPKPATWKEAQALGQTWGQWFSKGGAAGAAETRHQVRDRSYILLI